MPNGTVISAQNLGRISCERLSEHTVREWPCPPSLETTEEDGIVLDVDD